MSKNVIKKPVRVFIFNSILKNWAEEETTLLLHDLAIFLDENSKNLYLWLGPKSKSKVQEIGLKSASIVQNKFKDFKLVVLEDKLPGIVEKKLKDLLLKYGAPSHTIFVKDRDMRFYMLFGLIGVCLAVAYFVVVLTSLFWPNIGGNLHISASLYFIWITACQILMLICLCVFLTNGLIAMKIYRSRLVVIAFIGWLMAAGIFCYIMLGIYLFPFQEGSTISTYLISLNDLIVFLLANAIGFVLLAFPYLNQILYISKNSIK